MSKEYLIMKDPTRFLADRRHEGSCKCGRKEWKAK